MQAHIVVTGKLGKAQLAPDGQSGTTELKVIRVLKEHPLITGKRTLSIPRYVPESEGKTFVILGDVIKGQLDFYRGIPVQGDLDSIESYLTGAAKLFKEKPEKRLAFAFAYLNHPDPEIARDATALFFRAELADLRAARKAYDREKLLKWLEDKQAPLYRQSVFAKLLGACGTVEDKPRFQEYLSQADVEIDFLPGYYFLDPAEGRGAAFSVLADGKQSFARRQLALRTIRFILGDCSPEAREALGKRLTSVLDREDTADLIVEVLRSYQLWGQTDAVLGLYARRNESGEHFKALERAVVRYALQSPEPKASMFIAELRTKKPDMIADVEEYPQLEKAQPAKNP